MLGYEEHELLATTFQAITHPDDLEANLTYTRQLRAGEIDTYHIEKRYLHKCGATVWALLSVSIVRDANEAPLYIVSQIQDITSRKQMEEALRKSEHTYRALTEQAADGIYITDAQGNFLLVNPQTCAMAGCTEEELLRMNIRDFLIEEDLVHAPLRLEEIRMSKAIIQMERCVRRKDGTILYIESRARALDDERLQIIVHDVTARKQAEEQLARQAQELACSNADLQQFASVASHDLQEPLRKTQTFVDLFLTDYAQSLDPEGRDYLKRAMQAAGRMRSLIKDLLTLSRINTKGQPFVSMDLAQVARDVKVDLEVRIQETGGCVEVGELPILEADPTQMRQLLQNLIGNALKFHRQTEPPRVKVYRQDPPAAEPEQGTGSCCVVVEDNGIGFDEKYLERIFQPFQRLHGRQEYEGTGMGLAICRKIVERHGGWLTARSTPGQGATFVITLPLRHESTTRRAA
jgi:PAS domain S-box-containing protein